MAKQKAIDEMPYSIRNTHTKNQLELIRIAGNNSWEELGVICKIEVIVDQNGGKQFLGRVGSNL